MSAVSPNPNSITFSTKRLTTYGDEQTDNAYYIWLHLIGDTWASSTLRFNWDVKSCAAVLGNMVAESSINPGAWEGYIQQPNDIQSFGGGFGLVQWTPANKYINWAMSNSLAWNSPNVTGMNAQLSRLMYEYKNPNTQWSTVHGLKLTFEEFALNTRNLTLGELVYVFGSQYERPADLMVTLTFRQDCALHYYQLFAGKTAPKKSKWIYYLQSPAIKYL